MNESIVPLVEKEKGIIAFFRSEYFVLITFVSLITPLMAHTASLLLQVSNIKNTYYAYFFAFSFDLAIFAFSINGRRSQATGLAFIVFILNVCFFNLDNFSELVGYRQLIRFFVTVVISGAGSWIVHSYVVFFNEKIGERKEVARWVKLNQEKDQRILVLENRSGTYQLENKQLRTELQLLKSNPQNTVPVQVPTIKVEADVADMYKEIEFPFTCTKCAQTALTKMTFDGLVTYCKYANCKFKTSKPINHELINLNLNLKS